MGNYKIKVKDEAESKEAQELFFELGYRWNHNGKMYFKVSSGEILAYSRGVLFQCGDDTGKELTLPQLRDLVVLKRNDSRDANVNQGGEIPCLYDLYLTADKELYFYHCGKGKWLLSNLNHDEDYYATLKPIEKSEPQDPALISGAEAELVEQAKKFIARNHLNRFEAAKAHLEGHPVQFMLANGDFIDITSDTTLGIFEKDGGYSFRLKPTTLTVNAELPKPAREFQQNTEVYAVTYVFKTREERNAFADKLRGTNS